MGLYSKFIEAFSYGAERLLSMEAHGDKPFS
jgi:hypothetical protein